MIENEKSDYYRQLELRNDALDFTDWVLYFGEIALKAQARSQELIECLIAKSRFFQTYTSEMNNRQIKVVKRMFDAGPEGLEGGMSSKNYQSIAHLFLLLLVY